MSENEMIERVARCMHNSNELPGGGAMHDCALPDWSELSEVARSRFRNYARIALMAIREPTEAMCEANWTGPIYGGVDDGWRQMIDAALKTESA